jgi:Domain of unknown function (DUF4157)
MQTFAENPKATQQSASAWTATPDRPQFGHAHEGSYAQRAGRDQGAPPPPGAGANTGNGAGIAHFGHNFNRIPVHSNPGGSSPAREAVVPASGIRERVRASGVISARTALRPHEGSPATFQREAEIYAQGKTPVRAGGELAAWDAKPLGAPETGAHLREIQRQFGAEGVERSVRGLAHTRGEGFARSAAEHAGFSPAARSSAGGAIGQQAAGAIRASNVSGPLPDDVREKLTNASGHDFGDIAIYNDAAAHRAADLLNARAFTVGRGIYFGQDAYQPATPAGMHLLAHEAAHAVQQRGQESPPTAHARTTGSADREEEEATHFAASVTAQRSTVPPRLTPSTRTGLVPRAISFTHANDTFTTNNVVANENATGFRLASDPAPAFQWDTDVTIHGVAGDPFANFEVGFLQVERVFGINVHWGSGANETHRRVRPDALPRRDATAEANTWYDDGGPSLAAAFAANGDVRSPSFDDTPGTPRFPWANPTPGRASTRGWFNYGDAFVTYLSARDTTVGTGAAAFRHLANVYWNLSADGRFDTTQAVGARVTLTSPGAINHSRVIEGASGEFPAMHGGTIANGHDVTTDT